MNKKKQEQNSVKTKPYKIGSKTSIAVFMYIKSIKDAKPDTDVKVCHDVLCTCYLLKVSTNGHTLIRED